ncbi:MAG: hypothetical protein DCC68_11285 [Planctomycetota bacterium]|nr:MAG: hypothetical protein DCC68_11285 [Planctomycetota bacterium]
MQRLIRRPVEVFVGHLQVVLRRDRLAVAHPRADNVRREALFQFGLPTAAKILENLLPPAQPGPADNLLHPRP